MTSIHCALVVPEDQARFAQALWSELGLDAQDALDGTAAAAPEASSAERAFRGAVSTAFVEALACPTTLSRLAAARGMDFDPEQFVELCAKLHLTRLASF